MSVTFCTSNKSTSNKYDIIINGEIKEPVKNNIISYIAVSPTGRNYSYSGSGFPFHNLQQGLENTPNKGRLRLNDTRYTLKLLMPNSYYKGLGSVLVGPEVYISYQNLENIERNITVTLGSPVPYRSLTHSDGKYALARRDVNFYGSQFLLEPRSQTQILWDSRYPSVNKMHGNFWGSRPPK
jgi:hypothetical protein